jgi:hypothetical protein
MPLTCLLYGEGRREKRFICALIALDKFKYHTRLWHEPIIDNWHGCSAKDVLENCAKRASEASFNLVICILDIDDLKNDYPNTWEQEKNNFELKYSNIEIIWQIENAEDEYEKILQVSGLSKKEILSLAIAKIDRFVNSDYWNRVMACFQRKEAGPKLLS